VHELAVQRSRRVERVIELAPVGFELEYSLSKPVVVSLQLGGAIFELVEEANKHFQRTQPWQTVKDASRKGEVEASLYAGLEALRLIGYLLYPYMPTTSERIGEQLGVASPANAPWKDVARWGVLKSGQRVRSGPSLFPRLEIAKTA